MPDLSPAEILTAAGNLMLERADAMRPGVGVALADLMERAAEDFQMCERQNSRDPHNGGKTRILPLHLAASALTLARALLGGAA